MKECNARTLTPPKHRPNTILTLRITVHPLFLHGIRKLCFYVRLGARFLPAGQAFAPRGARRVPGRIDAGQPKKKPTSRRNRKTGPFRIIAGTERDMKVGSEESLTVSGEVSGKQTPCGEDARVFRSFACARGGSVPKLR